MYNKPIYLTSDVHLGAVGEETQSSFIDWLEWAASTGDQIIINGDLFDFWFEFRNGIPSGYTKSLSCLQSVVQNGVPITLIGGNHDWWGGKYLREEVGITFQQDPLLLELAGYRTFIAHGDGLGRGDLIYKCFKYFLHSKFLINLFSILEPKLGTWIAERVSRTKEKALNPCWQKYNRSESLKQWASGQLAREPCWDLIFLGHTHVPSIEQMGTDRYYINTGDWLYHQSFAILKYGQKPCLYSWKNGQKISLFSETSSREH